MSRDSTFRHTLAAASLAAATLFALPGPAAAQKAASAPMAASAGSAGKSTLASADRKFVETAAMGGMMEVALGKVAQAQGSDPQVKTFGERMVQDHSKANDELMKVASVKGVQLPAALDAKTQAEVDKYGKMSGADFDRAYMSHMVDDHKKDIAEFQKAAQSAKDGEVKEFATKTLPTLQTHLQLAQAANDAVKNKRGGAASSSKMAASAASR